MLVENSIISQEQLLEALGEQRKTKRKLGDLLISQGYITEQQLIEALADARLQSVSTLLDIKVLPKTMVHKYLSWWRVGGAQVADSEKIVAVARKLQENIDKARDY
ncbi:3D-(3,5/4)-trihydroxycyclohexane-1,2-dione hydrolase [compost metagenome]